MLETSTRFDLVSPRPPRQVDPKGSTILAGFDDGVVRLLNFQKREEVPGRKQKEPTQLLLKQAFKPHNGAVTALAIDSRGSLLATGVSTCTRSADESQATLGCYF